MAAFIVFVLFGTAKIQSWNYPGGRVPTEPAAQSDKKEDEDVTSKMLWLEREQINNWEK